MGGERTQIASSPQPFSALSHDSVNGVDEQMHKPLHLEASERQKQLEARQRAKNTGKSDKGTQTMIDATIMHELMETQEEVLNDPVGDSAGPTDSVCSFEEPVGNPTVLEYKATRRHALGCVGLKKPQKKEGGPIRQSVC